MSDPIRLGYHGSVRVATRIVRAAGRQDDDVVLRQYDVIDPFAMLRAGELDIMIVKFVLREPDLACSAALGTDERAAVMGAHHPLAGRASVSIEDLADFEAFRCPGKMPDYVWDEVVPHRTPLGRPIRRRHDVTTAAAMMDVVSRTDAVHLSLISLADIAPPTVRVVPIHDLPGAPVALAWREGDVPAAALELVRDAERATAGSRA